MITIIQTTSDNRTELEVLANDLVKRKLAACCQIDGPITSVYRWQNKIHNSKEFRLTIKTIKEYVFGISEYINEHHSYDLPEFIIFEAEVSKDYQKWVEDETA